MQKAVKLSFKPSMKDKTRAKNSETVIHTANRNVYKQSEKLFIPS